MSQLRGNVVKLNLNEYPKLIILFFNESLEPQNFCVNTNHWLIMLDPAL